MTDRIGWSPRQGGPKVELGDPGPVIEAYRRRIEFVQEPDLKAKAVDAADAGDLEALRAVFRKATFTDAPI